MAFLVFLISLCLFAESNVFKNFGFPLFSDVHWFAPCSPLSSLQYLSPAFSILLSCPTHSAYKPGDVLIHILMLRIL